MQKSIVVSTPDAEFSALAFKEDFRQSIKKVADLGFDGVELAIRNPEMVDIDNIKEILDKFKLFVPAIGTGQAFGEEGLCLTSPSSDIRNEAIERIKSHMDFASKIGNPQIIIGLIRGIVEEEDFTSQAREYFIEGMRECAEYDDEINLVIEPINRYETTLFNDLVSTKKVIKKIAKDNVKMLIDTFHMNIEEADMVESIYNVKDFITHVHFADSNRWAPGCGHIDFEKILDALKDINYSKALSAEILPEPTPEKSAELTMDFFKKKNL